MAEKIGRVEISLLKWALREIESHVPGFSGLEHGRLVYLIDRARNRPKRKKRTRK